MPLYEYRCEACQHQFEKIQKFSDDPITVCPSCGQGPVVKLLSSPAIQFKGSGWYITDYARKGDSGSSGASTTPPKKDASGDTGTASTPSAKSESSTPPPAATTSSKN
jgi:putative FmdB family regulatory protein